MEFKNKGNKKKIVNFKYFRININPYSKKE